MAQVADTILSKPRQPGNKGTARQLRASGWVPAVAYGPGQEPRHIAVDPKTFLAARMEHGIAHIYDIKVEGEGAFKALIKDVARDAVSRKLQHIDFYAVDMTKEIRLQVRVDLIGKPEGVVQGGLLQQVARRVEVQCLPGDIPGHLEVDVSHMNMGDTLHVSDIPLPKGVKVIATDDSAVAIVTAPETEDEAKSGEGQGGDASAAGDKK